MQSKTDSERAPLKHLKDVEVACSRDDEDFECLPFFLEDRVCDSWDLKYAEFVFMYLTFFNDLLPFTNFEHWVLV